MALSSTMYRFHIELNDIGEGRYLTFDPRVARHPSESIPFLLTRVIAYALNFQEGIAMTQGIAVPDEPALWVKDLTGAIQIWIDIGNPSARRLHKASKAAKLVRIYTHRDPEILAREVQGQEIHRREHIELFSIESKFLERLAETLERDNDWGLVRDGDELSVTVNGAIVHGILRIHRLK